MVKYRQAYYEACQIMISQSAHKARLEEHFDLQAILRPPTEQEYEREIETVAERRAANLNG